jgi:hypothetical protein
MRVRMTIDFKSVLNHLLYDKKTFKDEVLEYLYLMPYSKSRYLDECVKYYGSLNVEGKTVLDIGDDIGTSPIYFLKRGASVVYGYGLMNQHYYSPSYKHHKVCIDSKSIEFITLESRIYGCNVLKADCEGCEWDIPIEFIKSMKDWIIAVHNPVRNQELLDFLKTEGVLIAEPSELEFAIYKKVS